MCLEAFFIKPPQPQAVSSINCIPLSSAIFLSLLVYKALQACTTIIALVFFVIFLTKSSGSMFNVLSIFVITGTALDSIIASTVATNVND